MVAQRLSFDSETCAVCGRDTTGGHSFMRIYREAGRLEFCTPACAQVFNDEPARFGAGNGDRAASVNWAGVRERSFHDAG